MNTNRELARVAGAGWGLTERPSRIAGTQEEKQKREEKRKKETD